MKHEFLTYVLAWVWWIGFVLGLILGALIALLGGRN